MSIDLTSLKEGQKIELDGECKKVRSWLFKSEKYCIPSEHNDCDDKFIIIFEDGCSVEYSNQDLSNC